MWETRARLTLPVAYRSFCAPQMEGSTLQPPSSGITGTAPLGGGTWALEGCQCLGCAGPSLSLRGREAVTLCPSHLQPRSGSQSQIRSTLCVLKSPAMPRCPNHPQQGALLGPLPCVCRCPCHLLHLLVWDCQLLCPHPTKPGGKLIFNWVPRIVVMMVITLCPARCGVND